MRFNSIRNLFSIVAVLALAACGGGASSVVPTSIPVGQTGNFTPTGAVPPCPQSVVGRIVQFHLRTVIDAGGRKHLETCCDNGDGTGTCTTTGGPPSPPTPQPCEVITSSGRHTECSSVGGGGGGGGGAGVKTTIATSKGTARLTKCTSAGDAEKQALAQSYRLSAAAGGNEYGSNTYQDAYGNYYIVDPYTQNSHDQIDFGGTDSQINGLTLVGLVHDHFGYEDRSTNPPTFTDYDVSNWSANSPDDTTHTHFSVGDENVSEYYGVPILVILGNVNESFTWTPPAKDANGAFDLTAPDQSLGKVDQNFTC